ncbi:MAG: biotin--[acetyl-CoA-carboxylase] ligase [Gemmiger formicilis]
MVKQEVLAALDAARGRFISGQELAAQLSVSRTAVWKAVAALRRDGIPIKAVTNRGYTLAQSVDVLNAAAVAAQLDEATVKALQIEVVDRLPGTNAALRSRADAGAREGLVLIAQAQSAGRGRGGHSFYSPPGGLYMSILLRPEIGARQAVGLTAMAAVAAARAAERLCGVPITIKWVNDLWKNGKKVCGILTEAVLDLESGMLDYAVLGLGFNVAAPADGWPEDLRDVAGALYDGSLPRARGPRWRRRS